MTRGSRLILVYWLPALTWTAVILSASTDAFSATETGQVLAPIFTWILGHPLPPRRFEILHFLIRKAAHLTEYGILGALFFRAFRAEAETRWTPRWALWAVALTVAVALADESHQLFVPSRTGTMWDVALDAVGATAGVMATQGACLGAALRRNLLLFRR